MVSWFGSLPIPIGIAIVAILCGVGIYLWLCRLRAILDGGTSLHPIQPPQKEVQLMLPAAVRIPWRVQPMIETSLDFPEIFTPPTKLERQSVVLKTIAASKGLRYNPPVGIEIPYYRGYEAAGPEPIGWAVPPRAGVPPSAMKAPAAAQGFGWKVTSVFVALLIPIVLFSGFFFSACDYAVESMGVLLYWPNAWPGWAYVPAIDHMLSDLIFLTYTCFMLAYLLASGLFTGGGQFTRHQRVAAGIVFTGYILATWLVEAFLFTLPIVFLVITALLGGVFFMMLLFSTLMKPPPLKMPEARVRRRSVLGVFFASLVLAASLAIIILYLMWDFLGIGTGAPIIVQIRILVLLPLLTYAFWVVEGRLLYSREIERYPPAPVSMYHPDVSIIIPAYNEEVGIRQCIRCIDQAAKLYPGRVELIVANDGSSDRTSEMAHAELDKLRYARGKCLDLPHGGKARALNGALAETTGEIVFRIDADSFISPILGFNALVGHLANPHVGGVQGMILPLQRDGWTRKMRMLELTWRHMFLFRALMGTRTIQVVDGVFSAFRRRDLMAFGGWVPWNGEDCEITLRLERAGYTMRYEPAGLCFEDVPPNYVQLKKQRIRWSRGSFFAHGHHYGSMFSNAPEYCSLAMLYWLTMYARGGLRFMSLIYIAMLAILFPFFTFTTAVLIIAIVLLPKGLAMAYYLIKMRLYGDIPWIVTWPITALVKQYFSVEAWGTIFPGAMPEFSE